ncbi:MAG: biotin carboxylase [Psychroserpens sp.]
MKQQNNIALKGKRLLILGANPETVPLIDTAQELGVHVIVTDNNPEAFAKKFANESFNIDGMDVDGLVKLVREENIDGVLVGVADRLVEPYQQVCDALGLPCYASAEQCAVFTDKERFDIACKRFDISTIPNYQYAQILKAKNWEEFPLLVKPIDGNSGKGISICHSLEELKLGVEKARLASKRGRYLIEKFMDCEDMFIYFTFKDGDVLVSAIADRYTSKEQGDLGRVCIGAIYPSKHVELYFKNVHSKMLGFFQSLKMTNGILMIAAFVENNEIFFYDPGFRLQGEAPNIHVEEICKYDHKEMLIQQALGFPFGDKPLKKLIPCSFNQEFTASLWILSKIGTIKEIRGMNALQKDSSVFKIVQRLFEGDVISNTMIGTEAQVVMRVYIKANSKIELIGLIDEHSSNLKIIGKNEEVLSMTLNSSNNVHLTN